jgi:hypothetical protein
MTTTPNWQQRLNSWKEIAEFLGISVRAAQRWETERGLPVHRLPGARGPVYADLEELKRWWQQLQAGGEGNTPASPPATGEKVAAGRPAGVVRIEKALSRSAAARPKRWPWAVAVLLALFGTALWLPWRHRGDPAIYSLDQNILIVKDLDEHPLWRWQFKEPLNLGYYSDPATSRHPKVLFEDIDSDGENETLFHERSANPGTRPDALTCFSEAGKIKWRWTPGKAVATQTRSYEPDFAVLNFQVVAAGNGKAKSVLVSSSHYLHSACQIALLEGAHGTLLREYWHAGHIGASQLMIAADLNGDSRQEFYLGGVNNGSYNQATLVVLDPDSFEGASKETDPDYQWVGLAPGKEMARILFPRSCLNEKEQYNFVKQLNLEKNRLLVHVAETFPPEACTLIYHLDPETLQSEHVVFTDGFRNLHSRQALDRKIDHQELTPEEMASFYHLRFLTPYARIPVRQETP